MFIMDSDLFAVIVFRLSDFVNSNEFDMFKNPSIYSIRMNDTIIRFEHFHREPIN